MLARCNYRSCPFLRDHIIKLKINNKTKEYKIEVKKYGKKEIIYKIPGDFPIEMFNVIFGHDCKKIKSIFDLV